MGVFFVFSIMAGMYSPTNLAFQILSPVSITAEYCEKTDLSPASGSVCFVDTDRVKMSLRKFQGTQPISKVRLTIMIIAY